MDRPTMCDRKTCEAPAACALGLAFYAPKSPEADGSARTPIVRIVLKIRVCLPHWADAMRHGAFGLLGDQSLDWFVGMVEDAHHVPVDRAATRLVRVELTDPDYLAVMRASAAPSN